MKKDLGVVLAGLLCFSSYSGAEHTISESESISISDTLITQEEPAQIVQDVIERREIKKRDVVNLISKIDGERDVDRPRYDTPNLFDGFFLALEDRINEDPLFYAWEEYEPNDIVIQNQALSAGWDVLVARYPKLFGRIEKAAVKIKEVTTLETEVTKKYKLLVNPELDNDNYPRLKFRLKSEDKKLLDGLNFRVGREKVELGKSYSFPCVGKKVSLDIDLNYKYCGKYLARVTFKVPFWFSKQDENSEN